MKLGSKLMEFWRVSLKKRPIITNTVVYATFYSCAELTQQTYNKIYLPDHPELDLAAASRVVATGGSIYAPTLYVWYKYLDKKFSGKSIRAVAIKVTADQLFMTPILLAAFYTVLGVLERREDVFGELKEKFWKSFVANQAFWIPAQTVNFSLVPPHLRVVYVASVSFVWINILCYIKRQKKVQEELKE